MISSSTHLPQQMPGYHQRVLYLSPTRTHHSSLVDSTSTPPLQWPPLLHSHLLIWDQPSEWYAGTSNTQVTWSHLHATSSCMFPELCSGFSSFFELYFPSKFTYLSLTCQNSTLNSSLQEPPLYPRAACRNHSRSPRLGIHGPPACSLCHSTGRLTL